RQGGQPRRLGPRSLRARPLSGAGLHPWGRYALGLASNSIARSLPRAPRTRELAAPSHLPRCPPDTMTLANFRPIPGASSPPPSEGGGEAYPLEIDAEVFRNWDERATAYALDHLAALREGSALGLSGSEALEIAEQVSVDIPEEGLGATADASYQAALERFAEAVPASFNTAGPGYLAFIPGGGLPLAAIADLLSNLTNRFTGHTPAAPALARLEADVIRWLCRE